MQLFRAFWVPIGKGCFQWEGTLFAPQMNLLRRLLLAFFALTMLCITGLSASAQTVRSPNQYESDGAGAGGKWFEFHSEDKMTAARKVRFELLADNYLSEDPDYKPRIELVCSNGKYDY